eukprot:Skav222832  [mRNA]  locus=scaffold1338:43482:51341:- [translate_table: standard]
MGDRDGSRVPSWDGSARSWRRYVREVVWFVQSTKVSQRRHVATKLIACLTSSARLLAMSWPQSEFDHDRGVISYLQKLARSPLVRRSLPNAAAIMSQYFSFKRHPGEAISAFLVREVLNYEEFSEALLRLKEEKNGVDPSSYTFGLEEILRRGEAEEWWSSGWGRSYPEEAGDSGEAEEGAAPAGPTSPAGSPDRGSSSPRDDGYMPVSQRSDQGDGGYDAAAHGAEPLSSHDSFIMDVLRGWRLLVAASLSQEEWRDVLSSTGNRLDWDSVSNALQVLWDDQLVRPRGGGSYAHPHATGNLHWLEGDYDAFAAGSGDDWWTDGWEDDGAWWYEQQALWSPSGAASSPGGSDEAADLGDLQPAELDDEGIREAIQSEKMAESLAAEAKLTWRKAQQATAAARRDRGFGSVLGGGKSSTSKGRDDGCYICGSYQHYAKDCPDKLHPGKGKSKFGMTLEPYDMDYHNNMFSAKGSYKGFKGKKGFNHHNYVDGSLFWTSKGKSPPSKGFRKGFMKGIPTGVNAYGLELYPFELLPSSSSSSMASSGIPHPVRSHVHPMEGLLDTGATASAGPDASIRRLVQCLQGVDPKLEVVSDVSRRPMFRFGSGKWGRAVCHVKLTSALSGTPRTLELYVLPNPEEFYEKWFTPDLLVPILIGMNFVDQQGLVVDFSDGLTLSAAVSNAQPFHMRRNEKGHYVLDLVSFLTGTSLSDDQLSAMFPSSKSSKPVPPESSLLESGLCLYGVDQHEVVHASPPSSTSVRSRGREFFNSLVTRHGFDVQHWQPSSAQPSMTLGPGSACLAPRDPLPQAHDIQGLQEDARASSCPEEGERVGTRSLRPSLLEDMLAMFRRSQCLRERVEQVRGMGSLLSVSTSNELHSSGGSQHDQHEDRGLSPSPGGLESPSEGLAIECQAASRHGLQGSRLVDGKGDLLRDPELQGQPESQEQASLPESRPTLDPCFNSKGIRDESRCNSRIGAVHEPRRETADGTDQGKEETGTEPKLGEFQRSLKTSLPLPLRVAQAALAMMALMSASMSAAVQELVEDPLQHDVWEICCAPNSWLSMACAQQNVRAYRVNLANGFDLNKPSSFDRMWDLFVRHRPKKLWVSLRCTVWCPWQNLNYQGEERREVLEARRRRERGVMRNMTKFLLRVIAYDPMVEIYWEYPQRCEGWNQQVLIDFEDQLWHLNKDWKPCRIDGCRYDLRSGVPGYEDWFLLKKWLIKTTDLAFHANYKAKVCVRQHQHKTIEGQDTTRSSYYPWKMVVSIAKFWHRQLCPEHWLNKLSMAHDELVSDEEFANQVLGLSLVNSMKALEYEETSADVKVSAADKEMFPMTTTPSSSTTMTSGTFEARPEEAVSEKERQDWHAKLCHFHRAAGHPSNRNLARILKDANKEPWKIRACMSFRCSACEAVKPGGGASKQIPPASLGRLPRAWQVMMMDVGEMPFWHHKIKLKFLVMLDAATKYKVAVPLSTYGLSKQLNENTADMVEAVAQRWLSIYPKPHVIIPDNANTMTSTAFSDFCSQNNIWLCPPASKEPWAHGVAERAVQEIKTVMEKISLDDVTLSPSTCLALAVAGLNQAENVKGFSPFQWAFGQQFWLTDEDVATHAQLRDDYPFAEFSKLLTNRVMAEMHARKARAENTLTRLQNSSSRQPIREYRPSELVKVWRKLLPHEAHKGKRGGFVKSAKPHWVGPARVLFSELLPHQDGHDRRHVVWVVLGGRCLRCSIHSLRPLTEKEQVLHEITSDEQPLKWRSLADLLPRREYVDLIDEVPPDESELDPDQQLDADLPEHPNRHTWVSPTRVHGKRAPKDEELEPVNVYEPARGSIPDVMMPDDETTGTTEVHFSRRSSVTSRTPLLERSSSELPAIPQEDDEDLADPTPVTEPGMTPPGDEVVAEPDNKRARTGSADEDELLYAQMEDGHGFVMNIDLDFHSHRQFKKFVHAPAAFLVSKMRDCEVRYDRLTPDEKILFDRAKHKEVSSFISSAAVRRCLSAQEEDEAKLSKRIMGCRWVLTWKTTPPEDLASSKEEAKTNSSTTTLTSCGSRKAKARIVLLGYQHPDLLSEDYKTSAPVQSAVTRHLVFQLVVQKQWQLEGLDLSTAFLQTEQNQEQLRLWTTGVEELRSALNVEKGGVLRILKDFYGSTTAPRGLWKDLDATFCKLGAHRIIGDACVWIWSQPNKHPLNQYDQHEVIGIMSGHADDFNRAGDNSNPRWLEIKSKIDGAYKWGTTKRGSYRHVGADLAEKHHHSCGRYLEVSQDFYVETLQDLNLDPVRMSDEPLTPKEISMCRAHLGALQWLAVQTQPLICARCNLLLSDLTRSPTIKTAQELQEVINDVRKNPTKLQFKRIPSVQHWQQMVVITLGDQAPKNRPCGSSTGGLVSFLGGPEHLEGQAGPLTLISWKSWKLKRVSISSNDGEVQAMVESEDVNWRTRLLWSELNGAGIHRVPGVLLDQIEDQNSLVKGVIGTDSKGGFDAIAFQEGPYLGLSNARAAVEAYQLKQSLARTTSRLIWMSSDWMLADAMTKKAVEARKSLEQFLRQRIWMFKYDPEFVTSARKAKQLGLQATKVMNKIHRESRPKGKCSQEGFLD